MDRELSFEEYEKLNADLRERMREALEAKRRYKLVGDHVEDTHELEEKEEDHE